MTERILRSIRRRFSLMIGRFVLAAIDDSGVDRQGLVSPQRLKGQVFKGERPLEDVAHLQPYGLHSHPHPGAEGLAVAVGGSRSHLAVIAVDDPRHSPKNLVEGEVAIYDDQRVFILLKRGDKLEVRGALYDGSHTDVDILASETMDLTAQDGNMTLLCGGTGNKMTLGSLFGADIDLLAGGGALKIDALDDPIVINQNIKVNGNIEYTGTLKQTGAGIDLTVHKHDSLNHGDTGVPK